MANNRMFLGCKVCGECCYIAKWYPRGSWYANSEQEASKNLYAFFEEHVHHEAYNVGEEIFEIIYETNKTLSYYDTRDGSFGHKVKYKPATYTYVSIGKGTCN